MIEYYSKTDYRTIFYAISRIGLGSYLLAHSIPGIIDMDLFISTAISYIPESSPLTLLVYLIPIIPIMELFLGIMLIIGLYTKPALLWAVIIGVFFTFIFQFTGDLDGALEHSYSVIVKISLLFTVCYNKYSLDYLNLWNVARELKSIQQRYR